MDTIRLIEGYNDNCNIQYYRDYVIKDRKFLTDENLMSFEKLEPYLGNAKYKFEYGYFRGLYFDDDGEEDYIYFCIRQEQYIVYTDKGNIYMYNKYDGVQVYNPGGQDLTEVLAKGLNVGDYICEEDEQLEEITEVEIV